MRTRVLLIAVILLGSLAGCANPRRETELSRLPETRKAAAHELQQVLSEQAVATRDVRVEDDHMAWRAAPMPAQADAAWTERTLDFAEVLGVANLVEHRSGWVLSVEASGGQVTFFVAERLGALRARAALLRLAMPD